ncbi:MAG: DUF3817 domain-containing protein [Bacteroidota bacterium]|nr:DUF3817 domain-containing protein [Bacteroidota bacterium]
MLKVFKLVAFLEGISYLALFGNMLFIKHNNPDLYKTLLFPIGMSHGLLFIAYVVLAFLIKDEMKWNGKDFFLVLLASLIPFGTFWMEKKYLQGK